MKNKTFAGMTLAGLIAALLMIGACALKETGPDDDKAGVVISVKDSSKVHIVFDSDTITTFTDSGTFDLDSLRAKMNDKGIDAGTIEITGLVVSYDTTTRNFIAANEGVAFFLKIYIRENDTGATKLALETLVNDDVKTGLKALTFDPDMTFLKLGTDIFGSEEGFQSILNSLKDETKHKIKVIAKLTLKEKLKKQGTLNLNMIVTVAGKV
jgi:hypothetical protein